MSTASKMDYLSLLRGFNNWLGSNALPPLSQLLWYRLAGRANAAGWPEWVQVENHELMSLVGATREATFINTIRAPLIEKGLLLYQKGKKGYPGKYRFLYPGNTQCTALYTGTSESTSEVNSAVESVVQSVVNTVAESATIYKPDETKRNDIIPPTPPAGGTREGKPAKDAPRRKKALTLSSEQEKRFDRFWAAYPKKVSMGDAERSWGKICPDDALTERIIQAVDTAKRCDFRFREIKYTPLPASWLNDKGWLNEYGGEQRSSSTDGGNHSYDLEALDEYTLSHTPTVRPRDDA